MKEDDPEAALQAFKSIVDAETEKGDWCASSCPIIVAIDFSGSFKGIQSSKTVDKASFSDTSSSFGSPGNLYQIIDIHQISHNPQLLGKVNQWYFGLRGGRQRWRSRGRCVGEVLWSNKGCIRGRKERGGFIFRAGRNDLNLVSEAVHQD